MPNGGQEADIVTSGQALRGIRERQRPKESQRDAARFLEISEDRYRSYEYDRAELPQEYAHRLAKKWNVAWRDFYPSAERPLSVAEKPEPYALREVIQTPMVRLPILGVAGGGPVPVDPADGLDRDPEAGLLIPAECAMGNPSGAYAEGDSLLPLIQPGDKLVFENTPRPRLNKIIAVRRSDDPSHPVVKELRSIQGKLMLCSFNRNYEPFEMGDGDMVLGYLTCLISADGGLRIGPDMGGISGEMLAGRLRERLDGWDAIPA